MEFVSPEGLRVDGRRPKELRALAIELGVLPHADGSAAFSMGNTRVLAAVFGPREAVGRGAADPAKAMIRCECTTAQFAAAGRQRRGEHSRGVDRRASELSASVRDALEQTVLVELLPRAQIDVAVQVLNADGGVRAACVNAAFLALADAGVPCRDALAACAACHLESTALLDPGKQEETAAGPEVTVAAHAGEPRLVLLQADGRLGVEALDDVLGLAEAGCAAVHEALRAAVRERVALLAAARRLEVGGADGAHVSM
jgi:exosome complex component RRP41